MTDEFRAAGEFYGHLLTAVSFGNLTMRYELRIRSTDTDTISGRGFVYRWRMQINNRLVSAEHRVSGVELMQTRFLDDLARNVAARWRQEVGREQE